MLFSTLIKKIKLYEPSLDLTLLEKAYNLAKDYHGTQKRASGEKYIQHPLHVAYILAEHKLDITSLTAALLHDVVEDTDATLKQIGEEFGNDVANLVEGVTKIRKIKEISHDEYHSETIRKVMLASAKDIRVILIKLADRLHNMRTLSPFREEKRRRIAKDAIQIYAPIAYKLGIHSIKNEMEDLAFKVLDPEAFNDIDRRMKDTKQDRIIQMRRVKGIVDKELKLRDIDATIIGRTKHYYSIYKKMLRKGKTFSEIYDLIALRVITKNVRDCYEAVGIIHNIWTPIPKEFDDYIATPKMNMYQSLHTVVIASAGKPVEFQIRTQEMHRVAEDGIAAHWRYKGVYGDKEFDKKMGWMKEILEWQKESKDAKEFMEMLNVDFFEDEIFAFTPKGKVIQMPKGASVIDFAYAVHSELGDKCIAAKINGIFVPLRTLVKNGDQVEIITSKAQHPSRDWIKIAKTSKARTKIKQYVRNAQKIPIKRFDIPQDFEKKLEEWIIDVDHMVKPKIKLSKCCHPLPGDDIIGYATKTDRVIIHKTDCSTVIKENKSSVRKKIVHVSWLDSVESKVELRVQALNRIGIFAEILNTVVSLNTMIKSAKARSIDDDYILGSFEIEGKSLEELQELIERIKRIKDVKRVSIGNYQTSK
ncbi:bifunctional (p)ppGpp synthetase/guanosine-3',5'-bis(diphosphate) 3'-pyrophosphohydrolase [archaeon]|jgi:GTP diphosphokinase / guanosine-3',5'-bis(diphosphate) 3'-diphosphatase|nr:bifunctional (p)ppGpp synthetase/guanosine-3',5'-bis(diphosphate) 3'-pyrophosphohydrolase [archaeon]MBT4397366.1 bifunctional (p)ppGpp synthetase/guanosine-3',5'-bis(diphosphate) 3'-pyrophosphohydrolase [archaeon]MBT4440746.1 bifunctional (p)ppGpp synthetase/guanosine-3',5'-bis(diphosphate) 3'-pyrophosphohydrolase [archaeon]